MRTIFTHGSVHPELGAQIQHYIDLAGVNMTFHLRPLPLDAAIALEEWRSGTPPFDQWLEIDESLLASNVLWAVENADGFAESRPAIPKHAEWGCNFGGLLAIEYGPKNLALVNQLHELLHCLGVDDCYDESTFGPKASCQDDHCLMRYGNITLSVCESVLEQIRKHAS